MEKRRRLAFWSLLILIADIFVLLLFLTQCENIANSFTEIYKPIEREVPYFTKFSLSLFGNNIFFAILTLILIAKEFLKNKKTTLIINCVVLLLSIILFAIFVIALFLPIIHMTAPIK
jgi:hypothetical protein